MSWPAKGVVHVTVELLIPDAGVQGSPRQHAMCSSLFHRWRRRCPVRCAKVIAGRLVPVRVADRVKVNRAPQLL